MRRLRVLILGSTGSIGTQALEVIAANPDRFEVVGLAAGGGNPDLLARQRAETGVTNVAVADEGAAAQVGDVTYAGPEAATRLVENTEADVVLNALVGALGLHPTLAALNSGARLALANKESLIAGGPLVLECRQARSDRAGRLRALGAGPVPAGRHSRRGRQVGAHRVGRAVPGRLGSRPRARHPRTGRCASHLVDGSDEHPELGVAGQQGPRAHRDPPAVFHPVRPHRGGGPSAVDRAFDGHLHRRLHAGPGQSAGYEAADRAGAGLAEPGARGRPGLRLPHRLDLGVRAAGRRGVPGRRAGAGGRSARRLPDRGLQRRQRRGRRGVPRRPHPVPRHRANHRRGAARRRPVVRRTSYRGRRT